MRSSCNTALRCPRAHKDKGWRPFCWPVTMTAPKSKPSDSLPLVTVGDHLRKRRLDLGLSQVEVAAQLRLSEATIVNWERGKTEIEERFFPAVIAFLGYNPLPEAVTAGQAIRRARMSRGWSRQRLATLAGVDPATIGRIEADVPRPARKPRQAILRALGIEGGQTA
jgi:transcriptional regulator with XRE-family HTH domain